ncbi:retinaldehyde-binding protein 1-like [Uranotaenia lowii]|uniref:retinaldehyde-binding protein 1-like n=1 Tax=Uranotaenia lowii TaxID=190385 RepID=UPI0024797924|nr:retinaldehyde-binding protein 1-like [Uranotaenia lowii]XP_055613124.1 retinaldehyde-binding protein 1-like [Uranotaenia lowii]
MSLKYTEQNHPYIDLGDGYKICLYEDRCNHGEEFERRARELLNETPDRIEKCMADYRAMVTADPDLSVPFDDDYTKLFLRGGSFDPAGTYDLLKNCSRQKIATPEYFGRVANVMHVFEEGLVWLLPEKDEDGASVVVVESGKKWNTSKVSLLELNTAVNAVVAGLIKSQETQLHGCKLLFDVKGIGMSQIRQFTPKSTAITLSLMDNCSPIRILQSNTVNNDFVYNFLYSIMKPLLSKTMREKTFIFGKDFDALHKNISPKILPPRFGGTSTAPSYDGRLLGEMLLHYDDWLQQMHGYGYKRKEK